MKQATILVIILIVNIALNAFSLQNDYSCGERLIKIRGLVVGGKISQRGMWPWQVGIYKKQGVSGWQFSCGGALVSRQWVLTAAHCFYVGKNNTNRVWSEKDIKPLAKYKIKVGVHELRSYESSEQEHQFQEIFVHPDYRHDPIYENDIALVKLNREVILGPYVRTVCLPGPDLDLAKPGTAGMVAGWGITESGYGSSFLRYSSFSIKANNVCGKAISFYYNKTVAFCASDVKGHSAPCYGDSGGSMLRKLFLNGKYRYVTIGLVSWGGCTLGNQYGYYTRLQPFLPWIYHKVNSTCIGPGQLTNGVVNSTKSIYQPNEAIRFTCNINYIRIGKSVLTCNRDGTWNGYKPICLEVRCTNFHHPGDGGKIPQQSKFLPGEKIFIECKRGYTLLGKSSLICQSDGSWDGHWPYCSAPCPQPKQPKNGIQFGNNFSHGQTVRFKCNSYFKRIGSSTTTCINGKWNNQPPKCAAPCPDPGTPIDGHRYNHSFQHGDQVMFSCEKGMLLIGRKIITCSDGRWDQMTPTCIAVDCGRLPIPQNGEKIGETKTTYLGEVSFRCNKKGYQLKGSTRRVCQENGRWNGTLSRCEPVDCGRLPTPQHGEKIGETKSTYLGEVSFRCNKKGYQLKGSSRRVCQENGKWDGTLTKCEPVECPDPGKPDNGGRNPDLDKYVYESKIEYICKTNHTLKGDKHIICQHDKTWTGTKPTCLRPCSDPGIPRGGYRLHHSFLHADKVSFTCKSRWKMDGEKNIECNNGNWDNKAPTCLEGCTKPRHSPNGGVRPEKGFYYNGETVVMSCGENYQRIGDTSARCRNGKWSNKPPSCKRKCYNPGSPYYGWTNGDDFFEGKQVTFECSYGYDLVGLKTLECLDTGRWSGTVPSCKRRCTYSQPSSSKTTPIIADGVSVRHGTSIQFMCINDYTFVGDQTAVCKDGRWNPRIPMCKAPCQDPGRIVNGHLFGNTFTHRSSVRYVCIKGYSLDNPAPLICNDGRWNRPVPSCKKKCDDPGTPRNAIKNSNSLKHGSQVLYTCNGTTQLVGARRIVCNDGKWSSPPPKCFENCPDLGDIPNGIITNNGFKHGDKISIRCKSGFRILGSPELSCYNGKWTKRKPKCVECGFPLGMENRRIRDRNIRASSRWNSRYDAKYARLNRYGAWCSGPFNKSPYLEIDLKKPYRITYIATQGNARDNKWETEYTISHSLSKSSFIEYRENHKEKVFNGNSDATTVVKHKLKKSFIARKVRFRPIGYRFTGYLFKSSCMRVEIYGCDLPTDCVMVGSRVLGKWDSNYHGGDVYCKSYVKTIDDTYDEVDLEIEDDNHHNDEFKTMSKTHVVLDVPNKQLNLPTGTRVLAPLRNRYYTGTIESNSGTYYGVRFDDNTHAWILKREIRIHKPTQFCEG